MQAIFLSHGGGPMPLMGQQEDLAATLRQIGARLREEPAFDVVAVVSAHHEERTCTVQVEQEETAQLFYDYYGFPSETYNVAFEVRGASRELAEEIASTLISPDEGFQVQVKVEPRGLDHGVFVPLKVMGFPTPETKASSAVVQISLIDGLDVGEHLKLGARLRALREHFAESGRRVLVVGSGMSFHNMRAFSSQDKVWPAKTQALREACQRCLEEVAGGRSGALADLWAPETAQLVHDCHPRTEHLLPLLVASASTGGGKVPVSVEEFSYENRNGLVMSSWTFAGAEKKSE